MTNTVHEPTPAEVRTERLRTNKEGMRCYVTFDEPGGQHTATRVIVETESGCRVDAAARTQ